MRIGILGGGQLGRMLALEGAPLGHAFRVLDPASDACAGHVAPLINTEFVNAPRSKEFLRDLDCVTFEFENIPPDVVTAISKHCPVYPPARALAVAQDRISEKILFNQLSIPTPGFAAVNSLEKLRAVAPIIGYPCILKTCRMGYDGKGQFKLKSARDIETAWKQVGGVPMILERFVPFEKEVSLMVVRGRTGQLRYYKLVENVHHQGILRLSIGRPKYKHKLQRQAQRYGKKIVKDLKYVGVLAIEFFVVGDKLIANEMAPRVHNSGHGTWPGSRTSQFRNHILAITGEPLGRIQNLCYWAMVNLIGEAPAFADIPKRAGYYPHFYGKEFKPGRKVGHITVTSKNPNWLIKKLNALRGMPGVWLPEEIKFEW